MARYTSPGNEAIARAGCFDAAAAFELQSVLCQGHVQYYSGLTDQIAFPGLAAFLGNSAADAALLNAPLAGDQPLNSDGQTIILVDLVGFAHTVTTPANKIVNSKHILTWNGTIGSYAILKAMNGLWVPIGLSGVTVS
jgi:hypothetical protein